MNLLQRHIDLIDHIKAMRTHYVFLHSTCSTVTGCSTSSVRHFTKTNRPKPDPLINPQEAVGRGVMTIKDQRSVPRHKRSHALRLYMHGPVHIMVAFKGISWRRAKIEARAYLLERQT